jgi:predicted DNA-binding protein with PD1-like motif
MKSKLLSEGDGTRTYAVVLETGDEVMSCLRRFSEETGLGAAQLTGIGAFSRAVLGYFDWVSKTYLNNPVDQQVEVASLIGDVAIGPDGKSAPHIHVVLGTRDGGALAGHLVEGRVRPTLEVIVSEAPRHLRKVFDPVTHLALIQPEAP